MSGVPSRPRCSRSTRSARRPRRSCTTTSTAGCGRRRWSTSRASSATTACRRPTDELARWIRRGADRKSLELYLETFAHTVGVLQERDAIVRVAAECAEDLAADGVVYAEVRYAPGALDRAGPDPRRGGRGEPRGLPARMERARRGRQPDRHEGARHGDAPGGPIGRGRRVRGPLARRRRRRLRHRRPRGGLPPDPPPRRVRATSATRTSTSRSTPARASGCRRSGRRSSSAAPSGSATASGSSTTSRSATTARWSWAGSRRSSAIGASRSRCAPPRTSTPAPRPRSREHPIDLLRRLRFRVTRQHRQPADVRRVDVERVRGPRRGVRHRARRDGVADHQRA